MISRLSTFDLLKREAFFLADLIIEKYTSKDGGIFETVDVTDGKVVDSNCAVDELGDYIQYIIYLGILTPESNYVNWSLNTIQSISESYQSEKGLFYNKPKNILLKNNLLSINNADTITGLVSSYIYTKCDLLKPIIEKFAEGAFRHFTEYNYFGYGYLCGDKLKVSLANLLFSAYFIEEILSYMECTGDMNYLGRIRDVIDANIAHRYFNEHGVFQARIPLGLRGAVWSLAYRSIKNDSLKTTFLVKDNVYFLFALLKYYSIVRNDSIRDIITNTYNNLFRLFSQQGLIFNKWNPARGCIGAPSNLAHSHSIIELQLDLYHELDDEKYLNQAVEMTEIWLRRESSLQVINEVIEETESYSLLDSNVDLAINLVKLSEKAGRSAYLEKAFDIAMGVIKYFKAPHGYYWKIDTVNGNPLETKIETKYLGLLLKLFLVLMEAAHNKSVFRNKLLRNLARDR